MNLLSLHFTTKELGLVAVPKTDSKVGGQTEGNKHF